MTKTLDVDIQRCRIASGVVPASWWLGWLVHKVWGWLQRQPISISVSYDVPVEKPDYVTIDLDTPDLFNALYREMNEVYRSTNKRPAYLVMGNSQMAKLFRLGSDLLAYGVIPLSGPTVRSRHPELFGCRIICVPWIDGMFFLPDFEKGH